MGSVAIDLDDARRAVADTSSQVARLLRSLSTTGIPVPGSAWTLRDTAVHLAADITTNVDAASGADQHFDMPGRETASDRLATLNDRAVRQDVATDPAALAASVERAATAFLAAIEGRRGDERVKTPWYGERSSMDIDVMTCVVLGELVVHGHDMAQAAGQRWAIDPRHAALVLCGIADLLPLYLVPAGGARRHSAFEVSIRGSESFVVTVEGDRATVRTDAGAVDCHISADPVSLLLVAYGRRSQWGPILTGKMVAWGRRPWLGLSFRGLFTNP